MSAAERPPGHDTLIRKEPCPKCGSRDNLARYADGHAHCFSAGCGYWEPADGKTRPAPKKNAESPAGLGLGDGTRTYETIAERGIKKETARRYGYFTARDAKGREVQVAPYYGQDGREAALKARTKDKEFYVVKLDPDAPGITRLRLFGQHVFGDGYDRRVIVTEGEIDAMSVAQAMEFRYPAVSVGTGAEVVPHLQSNFTWLDRFAEIVLWFDDDAPGRLAAEKAAKLFPIGKVKIVRPIPGFKDANDLLMKQRPGDILQAVYNAETWRPNGVVNPADCLEDLFRSEAESWPFPFAGLHNMTGGIQPGEVAYLVAGTGVGKSTVFYELAHYLVKTGVKIGFMGFEATRRDVQMAFLSIHLSTRLDEVPVSRETLEEAHRDLFGSRLIEMFDPESAEWDMDAILGYVRLMAKAMDCQVIFIDPLSYIVAGLSQQDDERRALDRVSKDLSAHAKELGIGIVISHHLRRPSGDRGHEEGATTSLSQVRGSGGIANFASLVIGLERNQQGERPDLTLVRVLKSRRRGRTGEACVLRYDDVSGRSVESTEPYPQASGGSRTSRPQPRTTQGMDDY